MATLKGKWLFNETLTFGNPYMHITIDFTFGDIVGYGIIVRTDNIVQFEYYKSNGGNACYSYYQNGSWYNDNSRKINFGEVEQSVSDDFYNWFTANATQVIEKEPITINYNDIEIANFETGTKTLKCAGKKMATDVVINGACKITYNNVETNVEEGQTATLKCKGKKMISDVVVRKVEEEVSLITFTIDGTEYQAEEGMTWGQWVESKYNTINASIDSSSFVVNSSNDALYASSPDYSGYLTTNELITDEFEEYGGYTFQIHPNIGFGGF